MKIRAVVLCGGEGKRLRPLTNYFQKTMVPIGARSRPLLEYVVRLLVYHGVRDVTLLTGYKAEEIENYFGDGSRFKARINYSEDSPKMSGSAGALSHALHTKELRKFDQLIIYYGDVLSNLDIGQLVSTQVSSHAAATLVLSKGYALPVGVAQVKDKQVVSVKEKPTLDIDVTTGNMIINWKSTKLLEEVASTNRSTDLMHDFAPKLLERKLKVIPYYVKGFRYDIGSVEKYESLETSTVEKYLDFLDM